MPKGNDETVEVSVSFPIDFAEELRNQFPAGVSLSECTRTATEEAVRKRQENPTSSDIRDAMLEALETHEKNTEQD